MAGAFEDPLFADVTGAEVGVVLAAVCASVVDVVDEVGQVVVVVDVGAVVEVVVEVVVDVEVDVEVVEEEVVEVDDVVEVVVEVGVVVEVVDEVVVDVGQFGTVVDVVVVEDVVGAPELPVFAASPVVAAGTALDRARALPPAGDPSAMTAPRRVTVSSAPTLRARNPIEPPPIAVPRISTRSKCPPAHRKMNSPRPVRAASRALGVT